VFDKLRAYQVLDCIESLSEPKKIASFYSWRFSYVKTARYYGVVVVAVPESVGAETVTTRETLPVFPAASVAL